MFLRNRSGAALGFQSALTVACSQLSFFFIPHISDCSFSEHEGSFLVTMAETLRLRLSRGTIIAANIGQAMVNLKLWLSKSLSLHRQLHRGRGLNSQSLACESHTLPLGYHAIDKTIQKFKGDLKWRLLDHVVQQIYRSCHWSSTKKNFSMVSWIPYPRP